MNALGWAAPVIVLSAEERSASNGVLIIAALVAIALLLNLIL